MSRDGGEAVQPVCYKIFFQCCSSVDQ